jgi:hypothetical protein
MSAQKWARSSLRELSLRMEQAEHPVSHTTVARLLDHMGYSLHVNAKRVEANSSHPDRGEQFEHISAQRGAFQAAGLPVISVDTKKKELIGNFKNGGRAWSREAEAVSVHDFLQHALGRAVPYGIYDPTSNRGTVYVGSSGDTAQFAVDAIARWWEDEGRTTFPGARELLILADGGGSNGWLPRLWKQQLQVQLCDGLGLTVTVCHYPTGCSKWNPIEHRLFGPISINWAGKPLRSWDTMLAYIQGTRTSTGLEVSAFLQDGEYKTGQRVSDAEMKTLNLERHETCPNWNYTLRPRPTSGPAVASQPSEDREDIL